MRIITACMAAILLTSGVAEAADSRYRDWPAPREGARQFSREDQEPADQLQTLVDELKAMTREAERRRMADPSFVKDLRQLIRRYDYSWSVRLVEEDFSDGNFTRNPQWTVIQGDFKISRGGLTSWVKERPPRRAPRPSQQDNAGEDMGELIGQILGEILQQQAAQRNEPSRPAGRSIGGPGAKIVLDQEIPNSFSLTAVLSGRAEAGGIDLALYQGHAERRIGYRLTWMPSQGLALVRVTEGGVAIIERSAGTEIADGREHAVEWTRRAGGLMSVTLDGDELFQIRDRSFDSSFDGFALINRGGRFTLHDLGIDSGRRGR